MSDVVERLRAGFGYNCPSGETCHNQDTDMHLDSADEITTLRARIAELEAALEGKVPFDRPPFVPSPEPEGRTDDEDTPHEP